MSDLDSLPARAEANGISTFGDAQRAIGVEQNEYLDECDAARELLES